MSKVDEKPDGCRAVALGGDLGRKRGRPRGSLKNRTKATEPVEPGQDRPIPNLPDRYDHLKPGDLVIVEGRMAAGPFHCKAEVIEAERHGLRVALSRFPGKLKPGHRVSVSFFDLEVWPA